MRYVPSQTWLEHMGYKLTARTIGTHGSSTYQHEDGPTVVVWDTTQEVRLCLPPTTTLGPWRYLFTNVVSTRAELEREMIRWNFPLLPTPGA